MRATAGAAVLVHRGIRLISTPQGVRAYGAGILSSAGELRWSVMSPEPRRVAFNLQRMMRSRYRIDTFQASYFVIDSFQQLFEATAPDFTPVYREVRDTITELVRSKPATCCQASASTRFRLGVFFGPCLQQALQLATVPQHQPCEHAHPARCRLSAPGSVAVLGGEDDVVAVTVKARQAANVVVFPGCQCLQPTGMAAHLQRVPRHGKAREPGAPVRGRYRDGTGAAAGRCPSSAHQRRNATPPMLCATAMGGRPVWCSSRRTAAFDDGDVIIDRSENRLEVDRDKRHVVPGEPLQPAVPDATVADKPVHRQHAAAAGSGRSADGRASAG
jgi:hypothetical protein